MRTQPTSPRLGFTLVELLVVIAIITVLVALTVSGVFKTVEWQHRSNTKSEVNKLHGEVNKQWTATIDNARKEQPPGSVLTLASNDPRRAQVIWVKLRLKQEFPMSYAEAQNPGGGIIPLNDLPTKFPELRGRPPVGQSESAACLLLSMQKKRRGTGFDVEEALGSSAITDTDGDGVKEIVDSWGTPIQFYRWGMDHPGLAAAGDPTLGQLARDRDDPDHTLMNSGWLGTPNAATFEALCHRLRTGSPAQGYTVYTEPTIVSAGANRRFGLSGPYMGVSVPVDEADNIYSFQLR